MSNTLKTGCRLRNRYVLTRLLGEGGFGITYLAKDETLDSYVAIKEYCPGAIVSRERDGSLGPVEGQEADYNLGMERFLQEARVQASMLEVSGIVKTLDCFRENGTAYMVMEYVPGVTLRKQLECRIELYSFEEAMDLLRPVMEALQKIHQRGLLHRDISPDNIMVQEDGSLKLLDFGAAREYFLEQDRAKTMTMIAKSGYAPPEQYEPRSNQGPWTDIYALSATIYEMITGCIPEDARTRMAVDMLLPPSEYGAEITAEQEALLLTRGLSPMPSARFASVEEMLQAFYPEKAEPEKRRRWPVLAAVLVIAVLLIVGGACHHILQPPELPGLAGDYPRGSEEYKAFMDYVKKRAVKTEKQEENARNVEGTIYVLSEKDAREWGEPANENTFRDTRKDVEAFFKESGYPLKEESTEEDCFVTEEKYGVIRTCFGRKTVYRLKSKEKVIINYDIMNDRIYHLRVTVGDAADPDAFRPFAAYVAKMIGKTGEEARKTTEETQQKITAAIPATKKGISGPGRGRRIGTTSEPSSEIFLFQSDPGQYYLSIQPGNIVGDTQPYRW